MQDASAVCRATRSLYVSASHLECAETGFRALLASDSTRYHWASFMGLQGLLAAYGRDSELVTLVDSVIDAGNSVAMTPYLLHAIAGAAVEEQAL